MGSSLNQRAAEFSLCNTPCSSPTYHSNKPTSTRPTTDEDSLRGQHADLIEAITFRSGFVPLFSLRSNPFQM